LIENGGFVAPDDTSESDRPGITGVLETAIYVTDVERAVRFYVDILGCEILESDERLTALAVAGRHVLLVCRRGASVHLPRTPHDASGSQHIAFAVRASDLDGWERKLRNANVSIEEVRNWSRGGRSVYFRDPDGHLLELASPGVWSIY
jgi:catechol 2,3-dioxygenase-like lactoylglutathione lyase family enzyme